MPDRGPSRCDGSASSENGERGQLSLSVVEAGIGVVLILALSIGFALGGPAPDERNAQLDRYASDALTVLDGESPRHGDTTRLSEVTRSSDSFDRERDGLERRIDRILPENLLFRIETPHGTAGHPLPAEVDTGVSRTTTPGGEITIRVWYV